ncbi:MAG: hypothetical protein Q8938_11690 [Bacteroidota bacterium]|nr:hypothetical protein [Bacteroidota bacterium]
MKNIVWLTALGLLTIAGCSTSRKKGSADNRVAYSFSAAELRGKLDSALLGDTKSRLSSFFCVWHESSVPDDSSRVGSNDTVAAVYSIFRCFYKPFNLLKLGQWEWGNRLNEGARYIEVQGSIGYVVLPVDSVAQMNGFTNLKERTIVLDDFRPQVDVPDSMVLYMNSAYDSALNYFLGTASTTVGRGNIMNPSSPEGASERRYQLLRPWLPILHGHWGGYWHLETHPEVNLVLLNRSLNLAMVEFRVGYQGGECILDKKGTRWVIRQSSTTWIE